MGGTFDLVKADMSPKNRREFIRFPKYLYANEPRYVPFFDIDMRAVLKRKHPFFRSSPGDFFLIKRDGETAARCMLTENGRYNDHHKTNFAFFDFFDCIDDQETADFLFGAAAEWARERKLDALCGPMFTGGSAGAGLLVRGFEHMPAMTMMRYNFPYYAGLLESAGFEKRVDMKSFFLPPENFVLPARIKRLAEIVLARGRFEVLKFKNKRGLRKRADEVKALYNQILTHHQEDYPLTDAELEQVKKELLLVADPELISILTYDGSVAGFAFAFADVSRELVRNRGKIGPVEILRMLRGMKRSRKILFNGLGILPEYQRLGGNALIYHVMAEKVQKRGFSEIEMVQISEETELMLRDLHSLGAEPFKVHRLYLKRL